MNLRKQIQPKTVTISVMASGDMKIMLDNEHSGFELTLSPEQWKKLGEDARWFERHQGVVGAVPK